jgi:hypothetical protein
MGLVRLCDLPAEWLGIHLHAPRSDKFVLAADTYSQTTPINCRGEASRRPE